jgi:hypothetical protein
MLQAHGRPARMQVSPGVVIDGARVHRGCISQAACSQPKDSALARTRQLQTSGIICDECAHQRASVATVHFHLIRKPANELRPGYKSMYGCRSPFTQIRLKI